MTDQSRVGITGGGFGYDTSLFDSKRLPMIALCEGAIQPTILLCRILRAFVVWDNQRCGASQMYLKDRVPNGNFKSVAIGLSFTIQLTPPPSINWICGLNRNKVARSNWVEGKSAEALHSVLARESICRVRSEERRVGKECRS